MKPYNDSNQKHGDERGVKDDTLTSICHILIYSTLLVRTTNVSFKKTLDIEHTYWSLPDSVSPFIKSYEEGLMQLAL